MSSTSGVARHASIGDARHLAPRWSPGGRFILGLGAGSPPLAEGFHGVAVHRSGARRLGAADATSDDGCWRANAWSQVPSAGSRTAAGSRCGRRATVPIYPGRARPARGAAEPVRWRTPGRRFLLPMSAASAPASRLLEAGARAWRAGRGRGRSIEPSHPGGGVRPIRASGARGGLVVGRVLPGQHGAALPRDADPARPRPTRSRRCSPRTRPARTFERTRVGAGRCFDELTLWGDAERAQGKRSSRWYAAGARAARR